MPVQQKNLLHHYFGMHPITGFVSRNTRYSNCASTKQLRNLPNSCSERAVDSLGRVLRKQRRTCQSENTGCDIGRIRGSASPGWRGVKTARLASLSTNSTRRTAKAPAITSPRLLLERNFVFGCLVEAAGLEPGSEEVLTGRVT